MKKLKTKLLLLCGLVFLSVGSLEAQYTVPYTRFVTTERFNGVPLTRVQSLDHVNGAVSTNGSYPGWTFQPYTDNPPEKGRGGSATVDGRIALQLYNNGLNSNVIINGKTGAIVGAPLQLGFTSEHISAEFAAPAMLDNLLVTFRRPSGPNGLPIGLLAHLELFDIPSGQLIASLPTPISHVSVENHSVTIDGIRGRVFYRDFSGLNGYNIFNNSITNIYQNASSRFYPAIPQVDLMTGHILAINAQQGALKLQKFDPAVPGGAPVTLFTLPSGNSIFGNVVSLKGDEYKFLENLSGGTVALRVVNIRTNVVATHIVPPALWAGNTGFSGVIKFID